MGGSHQRPLGTFLPLPVLCCELQVPAKITDSKVLRPKKLLPLAKCADGRRQRGRAQPQSSDAVPKWPHSYRTKCSSFSYMGGPEMWKGLLPSS